MDRRKFLAAAAGVAPLYVPAHAFGANDRIDIGFIGVGRRASWLIANEEFAGAQITAIADINPANLDSAAKLRSSGDKWVKYNDYRRMLEKEQFDAVFVETTTHARALICLHALAAGKDVYAEKPLTLTIEEGRVLVKAARKYNRILQTGTQQRSMPINIHASRLVREGAIGKVHTVIVCNFLPPARWIPKPAEPMPAGLDWDQWCNQTELRPYHSQLQKNWALWWDYDGGGQSWGVSGWGTHALDQVQCALGADDTGPVELWPEEAGETGRITMKYANGTLVKLEEPKKAGLAQLGGCFMGDKGAIHIMRGEFIAIPGDLRSGAPEPVINGPGENRYHTANFFDCVKSRQKPLADVETGHRSTTVCHLVNICRDLGRKLRWDPVGERFIDDDQANRMISRPRRKGYELPKV